MTTMHFYNQVDQRPVEVPLPVVSELVVSQVKGQTETWMTQLSSIVAERPRMTAAVVGAVGAYAAYKAIKPYATRKWRAFQHKIHGTMPFEGESMQTGSTMDEQGVRDPPPCQVNLYQKGLFTTPFLGCGVRLKTILVVPYHVVRGVGAVIAENPITGDRMEVEAKVILSKAVSDLAYYQLPDSWWSQLAIKTAPSTSLPESLAMRSIPASIVSRKRSTVGSVQPLPLSMYKVTYDGSTLPGFSGALYIAEGGKILGMHQGVQAGKNLGFMWEAIVTDVSYRFEGKAAGVEGEGAGRNKRRRRDAGKGIYDEIPQATTSSNSLGGAWGYDSLHTQIGRANTPVECSWAQDTEVDYDADLQFEANRNANAVINDMCANMEDMSVAQLEVLVARATTEKMRKATMVGQNENSTVVLPEQDSTIFGQALSAAKAQAQLMIEDRVRPLEKRIALLETMRRPAADTTPAASTQEKAKAIGCEVCGKKFLTKTGLAQHKRMVKHPQPIVGEKATLVPFLGPKKQSSSSSQLPSTSSTSAGEKGSSPSTPRQPSVETTLTKLESFCENMLETMRGLKSALVPNCEA